MFMSFSASGIESGSGLIVWIKAEQNDVLNLLGVCPKSHII